MVFLVLALLLLYVVRYGRLTVQRAEIDNRGHEHHLRLRARPDSDPTGEAELLGLQEGLGKTRPGEHFRHLVLLGFHRIPLNYLCPLGDAGIGLATVVNGRVERVRY